MPDPKKDPFDNIYFWIKVIKISSVVLIPYWLFGLQASLLTGIIVLALFLSKISLTLLEINEYLHEKSTEKTHRKAPSRFSHPPEAEGKLIV